MLRLNISGKAQKINIRIQTFQLRYDTSLMVIDVMPFKVLWIVVPVCDIRNYFSIDVCFFEMVSNANDFSKHPSRSERANCLHWAEKALLDANIFHIIADIILFESYFPFLSK